MITTIIHDILAAFRQYTPYALMVGLFAVFVQCIFEGIVLKVSTNSIIQKNKRRWLLMLLFYYYCFMILSITLLSRETGSREGVDLKLFSTWSGNFSEDIYPIENILLFIPFGILLPLIWRKCNNASLCLAAALVFSTTIEVTQYLTQRGYLQTDDVVTNLFGTAIGLISVKGLKRMRRFL